MKSECGGHYYCQCGCGEEIIIKPYCKYKGIPKYISGHNGRCCSDETRKKLSERKGIKAGNYKDGRKAKLIEWKNAVKQRDNYTCQRCGKEKLQSNDCLSHHIKSKEDYPELIYDIDNGITFCKSCNAYICFKDKPVWNKGLTGNCTGKYIDGRRRKLEIWIFSVKKRDNYTCQRCGKINLQEKSCHAHHIKPKKDYPELIYDIDNGITLCISCHMFIHHIGKICSEETRKIISKKTKEAMDNLSPEKKEKLKYWQGKTGENHPSYNKSPSQETCKQTSQTLKKGFRDGTIVHWTQKERIAI